MHTYNAFSLFHLHTIATANRMKIVSLFLCRFITCSSCLFSESIGMHHQQIGSVPLCRNGRQPSTKIPVNWLKNAKLTPRYSFRSICDFTNKAVRNIELCLLCTVRAHQTILFFFFCFLSVMLMLSGGRRYLSRHVYVVCCVSCGK